MNNRIKICVLCFWFFMPKANATMRVPIVLMIGNDTFEIYQTFISFNRQITSNPKKMVEPKGVFEKPTWVIENDSLFLKQLEVYSDDEIFIDLAKNFKKNYVNGRVFAKEISYNILAARSNLFKMDRANDIFFYYENFCYLTIKNGKVVNKIEFTGISPTCSSHLYTEIADISQSTDWFTQPEVPLNSGTKVVTKIVVDDKGKVTKTEFTEGGDKRWNKTITKFIKLLSGSFFGHISYIDVYAKGVRRKKEIIKFIVKKPR